MQYFVCRYRNVGCTNYTVDHHFHSWNCYSVFVSKNKVRYVCHLLMNKRTTGYGSYKRLSK